MADPPMRVCPNNSRTLLDLDTDALTHCFGFLDIRDINLSMTCKPLVRVAYSDYVCNRLFRYNLALLFAQSLLFGRLRKMIADLEAPRFDSGGPLSQDPALSYIRSQKKLNDDQRRANHSSYFIGTFDACPKICLVGDHYQLPPLVQSVEARENGMSNSLFCRLSEAHPQAISALQCQRMCAGIMELSNALIYGNRLRCGSSEVADAKLKLSCSKPVTLWLQEILNANKPVIFASTDMLPANEERENSIVVNYTEAYIVAEITKELIKRDIAGDDIGIISPYNSQVNIIRRILDASIEVQTIDKYQLMTGIKIQVCREIHEVSLF